MDSIFVVLILSFASINCEPTFKWKDCGSAYEDVDIKLAGCSDARCTMFKGSKYSGDLTAVATSPTTKLNYKVEIQGLVPVVLAQGDACPELKIGHCALKEGDLFLFRTNFEIPSLTPTVRMQIKTIVKDDDDKMILCGELNVKVKHPPHLAFLDAFDLDL